MKKNFPSRCSAIFAAFFSLIFASACATAPMKQRLDATKTYQEICSVRPGIDEVTGSLWLKLQSKEAKGQFPAVIKVNHGSLKMEVTNLVGGREALIEVQGSKFTVIHQEKRLSGRNHWGGIPLQWAIPLFMGRPPCISADASTKIFWNEEDELVVQRSLPNLAKDSETMTYRFQSWAGKPWVSIAHWELKGSKQTQSVEFEFFDPDDKVGWPRRIQAKSDRGEVQIRWKDWNLKSASLPESAVTDSKPQTAP